MKNLELEKIGVRASSEVPYTLIENYILDMKGLSANKKMLLIMLRRHAGKNANVAYPSIRTLCNEIGVSKKDVVIKAIDFFVWVKWLEKVTTKNSKGFYNVNMYIISLKNIELVLNHFKENNYNLKDIEKYFESEYKDKDNREKLLKSCKFLK